MKSVRFGVAICWKDDWQSLPYSGKIEEKEKKHLDEMLKREYRDGLETARDNLDPDKDPLRTKVLNKILSAKFEIREKDISCVISFTPKEYDEFTAEMSDGSFCNSGEEMVDNGDQELFIDWFLEDL